jgi:catechol 2,3-dioxygenase-like lactoylglutathione lyase family enzyme
MSRGLDHIVHAVSDLEAAARFWRSAGFIVGARNRHPWGTHNHVVQLPGFFIEILTVAEPDKLGDDGLSRHFGIANRGAIARGDGFSALVLESRDIAADVAAFARAGIGISDALPFSRGATLPDGSETTVGFSLAFVRDELSPQTGFFACRQLNPKAFWNPAFQIHPNGVRAVAGAVLVADNPADHHIFLSAFTGERVLHSSSLGIEARTPRGSVEIMEPVAFEDQFGVARKVEGTAVSIVGLRLTVADLDATAATLEQGGVAALRHMDRLVVAPETAFGATLIFE